ncbi:ABC transporter substrate-binding protein [Buchananella hordeovulneris]|uniref:ABC transporter substrate-binding protein n=1 Tax=Buchananella hordeovulneris TaxID=52770 RepID=UPI000F5EC7A5|nr:ABC transporter substrate-binding protein [Buchananella hordeovulneris]MDO5079714.1 ABC transporter substrate-binding protein [Buchananella hordeovulneris]RRD45428.1 ABC transporter substrate-binding protein [Buchananella hordeovulneris]
MKRQLLTVMFAVSCLGACGTAESAFGPTSSDTIVVGSQDYYSNEIIAELYAQTLEAQGFEVEREFRIGQREVYLPEITAGHISVFPEYSGNLLQYWQPETSARTPQEVHAALQQATPDGLEVLDAAPASDQDSYTVTREFAEKWQLRSIADLRKVTVPLTLGANSEAETRPYGPRGIKDAYDLDIAFTPIEDSGGPLTVKALVEGQIQIANIYTADPAVDENNLVALEDTQGVFLSSQVVPVVSASLPPQAAEALNKLSAQLTTAELRELNARSVTQGLPAATIAREWLAAHPLP